MATTVARVVKIYNKSGKAVNTVSISLNISSST